MSSNLTEPTKSLDGVMGNTPEFGSGILSSNLSPVSKNVGFSLFGKASVCATVEQGSNPGVNPEHKNSIGYSLTGKAPGWRYKFESY